MQKKSAKNPRKITKTYLENAALHYLGRYAATSAQLITVLKRKIQRSAKFHGHTPDEFYPLVDNIIARYIQSGLLNDESYTQNRIHSLRRAGVSQKVIMLKLRQKGVSKDMVEQHMSAQNAEDEHEAAVIFARKKHLGPYKKTAKQDPRKENLKDMAKMARAGFSFEVIRHVIGDNREFEE